MSIQVSCWACVLASILSFQSLPRTLIVVAFDGCFQGFRIGIAGNDEALLMSSCYQGIPARLGDRGEVYLLADLAGEWGFLGGCMFCVPDGFTLLVSDEEAFGLCLRFYGCYLAFMGQIANLAPNESSNKADIHVLLDSCESYMIKKEDVENIIQKVQAAVSKWENLAILLQIPGREMDMFKERFKLNL